MWAVGVAQLAEQLLPTPVVRSSNRVIDTFLKNIYLLHLKRQK